MSAHAYPYGRPAERYGASPDRYAYFVRRVGLRWQVWHEYEDGHPDPNGAVEWRAVWGLAFWRRVNALRVAAEMQVAHYQGGYLSDLPTTPAPALESGGRP